MIPGRDNMRKALNIEVVSHPLRDHLPEDVEPGDHWECVNGCRHFQCFLCEGIFNTNEIIEHDPNDTDLPTSICDGCNDKVAAVFA